MLSESTLSFGEFSLERKYIWVCEGMTCSLSNASFSETSFILPDTPLPKVKSVSFVPDTGSYALTLKSGWNKTNMEKLQ